MNAMKTNLGAGDMRERMLDFAAYVLTSARSLYREPQSYGPMRLADTLDKGLELLQAAGIRNETVEQAMAAVRESRPVAMTDPEGFAEALDRAIAVLVQATLEGKPEA
ncbi:MULTISPECIES: DUF6092 family protein [Paenibacillus]|uniref:DUF6092 family protein n=1 Tax=Paenibacillus TaxID=44249 RepID=UPI000B7F9224|nr:DUF6092 family protein [Paenibacillus sp. SSG-1]OXL85118.1 hypothetical protein BCV73_19925 [Paenibacillus sp. SSG-1]